MRTPEGYEKDDISKFLNSLDDCWHFRPLMMGFGKSGISDIVGCYRMRFFSIEVKRDGKKPTVIQTRRLQEVQAAGGLGYWGTAEKVIREFKRDFLLAP